MILCFLASQTRNSEIKMPNGMTSSMESLCFDLLPKQYTARAINRSSQSQKSFPHSSPLPLSPAHRIFRSGFPPREPENLPGRAPFLLREGRSRRGRAPLFFPPPILAGLFREFFPSGKAGRVSPARLHPRRIRNWPSPGCSAGCAYIGHVRDRKGPQISARPVASRPLSIILGIFCRGPQSGDIRRPRMPGRKGPPAEGGLRAASRPAEFLAGPRTRKVPT